MILQKHQKTYVSKLLTGIRFSKMALPLNSEFWTGYGSGNWAFQPDLVFGVWVLNISEWISV